MHSPCCIQHMHVDSVHTNQTIINVTQKSHLQAIAVLMHITTYSSYLCSVFV